MRILNLHKNLSKKKNLSKFLAAALLLALSTQAAPALAQTASSDETVNTLTQTDQPPDNQALDQYFDQNLNSNDQFNAEARRPRPRPPLPVPGGRWVCYSHDFFGGQYYGQGRSREQARRMALRSCQVYAHTPITVCFDDGCEFGY